MSNIFQKLTNHSKIALRSAFSLALSLGHRNITPQHLLYGLSLQKGSIAGQILAKAKIGEKQIKQALADNQINHETITQVGLAPATKKIIEKSFLIATQNQHRYVGTEHLLASMLLTKDNFLHDFFTGQGTDLLLMQSQIDTILASTSKFPNLTSSLHFFDSENKDEADFESGLAANWSSQTAINTGANTQTILDLFGTNLTDLTIQKNIDPVIGREDEIDRLIQILSRRNKNNPLLLGDPGVGKTAIVEGLAKKITQGDVPQILLGKTIYALDLSLVVAGTSFRGEFENRLKQIIAQAKKNPNIILFIDEIHNIIGVGSATGSMDAANILKPALARGEIRLIGATTLDGYKKYIETDSALERRFQSIYVSQPSVEKTIEILKGIKDNYEIFHGVKISPPAITAAAQFSNRYLVDRFLPDKAIDLIDEAAAAVKIKNQTNPVIKELTDLENQAYDLGQKKKLYVSQEKFPLALKYRQQENELLVQVRELREKQKKDTPKLLPEISQKDIAQIVAKMTGIPLTDLVLEEKNHLLNLEKLLAQKIVGQPQAVSAVAELVRRSRTGISDDRRPIGSFIFLGPSGVGKTELAKVLAEVVFGSPQALVKIDMSEFAESFNISKLIGSPAGYVGYKEGTKLTDAVKHRPYSVVLFDEIEKAHSQVFSLLLQILEDGCLTDGTGKLINFKNTIIILTSNLGSESFNQSAALGFQAATGAKKYELEKNFAEIEKDVLNKLKGKFPPEFLSRIDKTIVFNPLTINDLSKIAGLGLSELKLRLKKQKINLAIQPKVADLIAKISYTPQTGARAIRKTISELIENNIAKKILAAKNPGRQKITIKIKDNKIII